MFFTDMNKDRTCARTSPQPFQRIRWTTHRGFSWLFVTPQVTIHRIWRPCGRSCHALTQRPGAERFRDFRGLDDANVDDGTSSSSSINDMLFKITIIIM